MSDFYSDEKLLKDYHRLDPEYRYKVEKYVKDLYRLQRMERRVTGAIRGIEWKNSQEKHDSDIHCSFCGSPPSGECLMIAGPDNLYICEECSRECVEIIEETLDKQSENE